MFAHSWIELTLKRSALIARDVQRYNIYTAALSDLNRRAGLVKKVAVTPSFGRQ